MKRGYDSDEDDYYGSGSSYNSRKFDFNPSESKLRFVSASDSDPKQEAERSTKTEPKRRILTDDEKNSLAAKILKAELSGKKDRVKALKAKLESGYADDDNEKAKDEHILLMKMDKKTGLIAPASSKSKYEDYSTSGPSSTVLSSYERSSTLQELINEEKTTSAKDHLEIFERALKMTASNKTTDDFVIDDNVETHRKKRRHRDEDSRKEHSKQIAEHKNIERTLGNCLLCLEKCDKSIIVAVGFKTYLSVIPWKGLNDFHCRIIPSEHCLSTVNLDEDVQAEMRIWRKGLVAMFGAENEDCVFIETAKVESGKNHMSIECIPMPRESGDLAPIYFKEALETAGSEWATHKKLFKLSDSKDGTVRTVIPKGFSYFSVDFGLQPGFACVIENESKFQSYFGQEIVGGILDAEHKQWRNVDMESKSDLKNKRDRFKERWANFDWTEEARKRLAES